jgi:hypothetical protein
MERTSMNETPYKPMSVFEPKQVVCARHCEPFRAKWPNGYSVFSTSAISFVLADPAFMEEIKGESGPDYGLAGAALNRKPVCCRLPPAKLVQFYLDAKIGSVAHCVACGTKREGTPFYFETPHGGAELLPHLCFQCVASGREIPVTLSMTAAEAAVISRPKAPINRPLLGRSHRRRRGNRG